MKALLFRGVDGSNPLAYLAALGAFRLLSGVRLAARMRWVLEGTWQPEVTGLEDLDEQGVCDLLARLPGVPVETFSGLGKNITVPTATFQVFAEQAGAAASAKDRRAADFAASFGSEACIDEKKDRIQYTSFCFITGSGHQDFLDTTTQLVVRVGPDPLLSRTFLNGRNAS